MCVVYRERESCENERKEGVCSAVMKPREREREKMRNIREKREKI